MKKISLLVLLVITGFGTISVLSGCEPQKNQPSAAQVSKQKAAAVSKRKVQAVQAKIKDGTYQFTKLPKEDLYTPYRFTTALGEFTTGESYLAGGGKSETDPNAWTGFKIDYTYKNTTNQPQDAVKAFSRVFRVQTMQIWQPTKLKAIKAIPTFSGYHGMDGPRTEQDARRIANRGKLVQPGESIDVINAYGVSAKVYANNAPKKKIKKRAPLNYTIDVLADPDSKVVLKRYDAEIVWRFD